MGGVGTGPVRPLGAGAPAYGTASAQRRRPGREWYTGPTHSGTTGTRRTATSVLPQAHAACVVCRGCSGPSSGAAAFQFRLCHVNTLPPATIRHLDKSINDHVQSTAESQLMHSKRYGNRGSSLRRQHTNRFSAQEDLSPAELIRTGDEDLARPLTAAQIPPRLNVHASGTRAQSSPLYRQELLIREYEIQLLASKADLILIGFTPLAEIRPSFRRELRNVRKRLSTFKARDRLLDVLLIPASAQRDDEQQQEDGDRARVPHPHRPFGAALPHPGVLARESGSGRRRLHFLAIVPAKVLLFRNGGTFRYVDVWGYAFFASITHLSTSPHGSSVHIPQRSSKSGMMSLSKGSFSRTRPVVAPTIERAAPCTYAPLTEPCSS